MVGELLRAVQMPENVFNAEQGKLRGMNETNASVELPSAFSDDASVRKKVYEAVNVLQVPSSEEGEMKFAGQTLTAKSLVLVKLARSGGGDKMDVTINCEKIVVGSMLAKELTRHLQQS